MKIVLPKFPSVFPGLLLCEEKMELIRDYVLALQREAEELTEGFSVTYRGQEYDFLPSFKDR